MKKRILVVEDHAETRRALKLFLETIGYDVILAEGVQSARTLAKSNPFDVLVCDLNLPDGTGWELLKKLSRKRLISAVAVSGWGSASDVIKSKEAGFVAHLVKPIIPEELVEAINRAIALSAQANSETKRARNKKIDLGDAGSDCFAL